jgi:Lrp/AsnC family leucine-responsive transcriptional regulator
MLARGSLNAVENAVIDDLDRAIIAGLSRDARISWRALGEEVRLSANAVAERVRRLERAGVIRGYGVELDQARLGRTIEAMIDVRISAGTDPDAFEATLLEQPEVVDVVHLTGRWDYQVRVWCRDVSALDAVTRTLKRRLGAETTESRVVLRRATRHGR